MKANSAGVQADLAGLIRAKRSSHPRCTNLLTRTARRGDTQRVALVRDALRLLGVLVTYQVSRRLVRPSAEVFWHPLDFGMQRRQLLNLKRLAETA